MKWLFDGKPCEDIPLLTEPWCDFKDNVKIDFWVKPLEKTTSDGDPNRQSLSRVSGVWEMNLATDPDTGNKGLELQIMSHSSEKRMMPIAGSGALWIADFFEPASLGKWHHIIFGYDKRKVTFTIDGVTRKATMPDDMRRRCNETQWWFGYDHGNLGVNALFDEAVMIIRPDRKREAILHK